MPPSNVHNGASNSDGARKVLIAAYSVILFAGPALGILSLRSSEWLVFSACMVGTAIGITGLVQTIRNKDTHFWGCVYIYTLQAVISFAVVKTGGALSGATSWLFTMPILAAILIGTRGALINAGITAVFFVGITAAHFTKGNWKRIDNLDEAALLAGASHILALAVLFCLVIVAGKRMHRIQNDLRSARYEAQNANLAKSAFLANMSHEIRTPMNGIIGMAEMTLDGELKDGERESIHTILSCSQSLLEIINDILDISKIEADSLTLESIAYSPEEVLEGVLDSLAIRAHSRGLKLNGYFSGPHPKQLIGDPTRIRQVLFNLVGNALKFTENGEVVIKCTWRRLKQQLEIHVTDTGIGIPLDRQRAIFDEFVQADVSTTREYGGTGLGLCISQKLVHAMGGEIAVKSTPNGGSDFSFCIPSKSEKSTSSKRWQGKRALVISESNAEANALVCGMQNSGAGVEVCTWTELLETGPGSFDLVFSCATTPTQEGLAQIRKWKMAGVPVVTVTDPGSESTDLNVTGKSGLSLTRPVKPSSVAKLMKKAWQDEAAAALEDSETPSACNNAQWAACVLLVEDNAVNAKVAIHSLKKHGLEIIWAKNGREALEVLHEHDFDLILMDCQMPEMDGFEATRRIRRLDTRNSTLPVVALTAGAMDKDRQRCFSAGMDAYLSKPFKREDLARMLSGFLDRRAA